MNESEKGYHYPLYSTCDGRQRPNRCHDDVNASVVYDHELVCVDFQ